MSGKIGKSYWFDLLAVDAVDARSFYEGLFSWEFLLLSDAAVPDYWVIQVGGELIGGMRQVPSKTPSQGPVLYFTVDDLDFYSKRIRELGGSLEGPRVDLGKNRGSYQWFRDREKNMAALWAPSKETI